MNKFEKILKIGSTVARPFIPGGVGTILDVVTANIEDKSDLTNNEGLKTVAGNVDDLAQAILALHERVKVLEAK